MAKNKNRFSVFSLKERAEIVKRERENKQRELEYINKLYNLFSEGGPKEGYSGLEYDFENAFDRYVSASMAGVEIPRELPSYSEEETTSTVESEKYIVKSGDSLSKIAKSLNVSLEELKSLNPMKDYNKIQIGQSLTIPTQQKKVSEEERFDSYEVKRGDTFSKIARANNLTVDELKSLNPDISNINFLQIGQSINLGQIHDTPISEETMKSWKSLEEVRRKEAEYNRTNLGAIQGATHSSNYVVIDKKGKKLTVYNSKNEVVWETTDISTGLSGNDYNTITYVNSNGTIRNGVGNNSTPAGVTRISSITDYHGAPAFQRARLDNEGNILRVVNSKGEEVDDTIASSLHSGNTSRVYSSNGCVRMSNKALTELAQYIDVGTLVYTLPDKEGSRFVLKDGNLNFEADNPYGETEKGKSFNSYGKDTVYHDDYNTFNNRTYSPIRIEYDATGMSNNKRENINTVISGLEENKRAIQQYFNISDYHYNKIAQLALGILEQESKFGDSKMYKAKNLLKLMPVDPENPNASDATMFDVFKTLSGNTTVDSLGMGQIKMEGDNLELQQIYQDFGITPESVASDEKTAEALMLRLLYTYNAEVRGRVYKNAETGEPLDGYDVLLYKYKGGKTASTLRKGKATGNNEYVQNVKAYADRFNFFIYN